jgi:hypothetical protein
VFLNPEHIVQMSGVSPNAKDGATEIYCTTGGDFRVAETMDQINAWIAEHAPAA